MHEPTNSLSKELRNEIYAYCGPESNDPDYDSRFSSAERTQLRAYIRLAHVNRQIRSEFLPMHLQMIDHRICLEDVPLWTQEMVPGLSRVAYGTLTLDISNMNSAKSMRTISLRTIFDFYKIHCVKVIIASPRTPGSTPQTPAELRLSRLDELFTKLFAPGDNPTGHRKWLEYYDMAVRSIDVQFWDTNDKTNFAQTTISVFKEYDKRSLDTGLRQWTFTGNDAVSRAWLKDSGYPGLFEGQSLTVNVHPWSR